MQVVRIPLIQIHRNTLCDITRVHFLVGNGQLHFRWLALRLRRHDDQFSLIRQNANRSDLMAAHTAVLQISATGQNFSHTGFYLF